MNGAVAPPAITGLDAITQSLGAAIYIVIGVAAWLHAPRDIRTRVFLGLAMASAAAFMPVPIAYVRGIRAAASLPRTFIAIAMSGLSMGALLLFHLTQVFPRRRVWIRDSGFQMAVAYILTPIVVSGLVWFFPENVADLTQGYIIGFLVFGFPLLVLLAIVVPVAAIVSLARSYGECGTADRPELLKARRPIAVILFSQIAGGALAIVFQPVLVVIAPNSLAQTTLTLVIWAIGLMTPVAFAIAVWKLRILSVDPSLS